MSNPSLKRPYSAAVDFLLMLAAAFLLVLKQGYRFLVGDQTQYFLRTFTTLNPNFAPNDWYTWKTATPDLNSSFTQLILLLSKLSKYDIPLEISVFSVWLLFCIFLIYSIRRLCDALTSDYRVFWITLTLLLFSYSGSWGGYGILGNLVPSRMVVPIFIMSLVFMAEEKYWLAGLFWGLSSIVHVAYGITGMFIYGSYLILRPERSGLKNWLRFAGGFLLLGSPAIISTVYSFIYQADKLSLPEDYKILLFRSPHHFLPSSWGMTIHVKMLMFIAVALYSIKFSRYKLKQDTLLWFSATILLFLAIATLFTEVVFNSYILRLFFWRFASYITLSCHIYAGVLILDLLDRKDYLASLNAGVLLLAYLMIAISRVYTILALCVFTGFCIAQLLERLRVDKRLIGAGYILGLILLAFFPLNYIVENLPSQFQAAELHSSGIANIYGVLLSALLIVGLFLLSDKYQFKNGAAAVLAIPFAVLHLSGVNQIGFKPENITSATKYEKNYEEVLDWTRRNTKPEDNFIIPPDLQGFTVRSGRGLMVCYKCVPVKGYELREWKTRMDKLNNYNNLPPDRVKKLASEYGITYFVALRPHKNEAAFLDYGFKYLFQNKLYVIYKIP